jgi:hypothetical protein
VTRRPIRVESYRFPFGPGRYDSAPLAFTFAAVAGMESRLKLWNEILLWDFTCSGR